MKKLLAVLLAITVVMSMGVVAFADHTGTDHGTAADAAVGTASGLTSSGGSVHFGKTEFYLNIEKNAVSDETTISATVPLWVCMYAYGGDGKVVTPADSMYKIINTGTDTDIKVYAMRATSQDSWSFAAFEDGVYDDSGKYVRANNTLTEAKKLAMTIKGMDLSTVEQAGMTELETPWKVTKNNGDLELPLKAYIAPGGLNEGNDTNVVNVMYYITAA